MAASVAVIVPALGKQIIVPTGLFINNKYVPSSDSQDLIRSEFGSVMITVVLILTRLPA
jgi:hypothetical protein